MTKLDLIELIINVDDDIFEELKYDDWDLEHLEKLLLLANKIDYIGEIDKIGYIEISNEHLYVEPKVNCEFTNFEILEMNNVSFDYRWNIKKE